MTRRSRSIALGAALCGLMMSFVATAPALASVRFPQLQPLVPGARAPLPSIRSVVLSPGSGGYTATISGAHFGAVPGDIPCSACTPVELQVQDLATYSVPQPVNVTAWSDTSVTVTGIAASPGDALQIVVFNDAVGEGAAWGGLSSKVKGVPKIRSVATSGSGQALTVTVTGQGFGAAPAEVGSNTNSPFFMFSDINGAPSGFGGERWNGGFCGANECDGVTMGYVSWSDTQIVMSTFGTSYGQDNWFSTPRDAFCVAVWPSTSISNGTSGAATKCARLPATGAAWWRFDDGE